MKHNGQAQIYQARRHWTVERKHTELIGRIYNHYASYQHKIDHIYIPQTLQSFVKICTTKVSNIYSLSYFVQ